MASRGKSSAPNPLKHGRLLIGIGTTVCIGMGLAILLLLRSHCLLAHVISKPAGRTDVSSTVVQHKPRPSARVDPPVRKPSGPRMGSGILRHGDPQSNLVALTFDDGPHPAYTAHELAILDRYGVKATFFLVGKMARRYPKTVRAIRDAGHIVGNHTWDHRPLSGLPDLTVKAEWAGCSSVLHSILGEWPTYCRPPGCNMKEGAVFYAADEGMTVVLYTVNSSDYNYPGRNAILRKILSNVKGGDTILMHDGVNQTIDILPKLIEVLQARGFRLVTVEELGASLNGP